MRLAINNQIFNCHSMPFECKKDVTMNCTKIVTDKSQNQLSKPKTGHYTTAKRGNFLSQEEVAGIDRIKTP